MKKQTVFAMFLISSVSLGSVFIQTEWSEPGSTGPVRDFIREFQSADGVNWWTGPGYLVLDNSPLRHGVDALSRGVSSIICEDMNSDGNTDLVVCEFRRGIVVYENTGSGGGFMIHPVFDSDGAGPERLACADFDGDGDRDLACTFTGDAGICWLENTGYSRWALHPLEISRGTAIDAGDVDSDGDPDLLIGTDDPGQLFWLENQESGTVWIAHEVDSDLKSPRAVKVSENGLLASSFGDAAFYGYHGSGDTWNREIIDEVMGPLCVETADMDGDGGSDLILCSSWEDRVFWMRTDGSELERVTISEDMIAPGWLSAADLDNDGDMDVLGVSEAAGEIVWWENTHGGERFFTHYLGSIPGLSCCAWGDMDGDGVPDPAAGSLLDGTVSWFSTGEYRSHGTLTSSILYIGPQADGISIQWDGETPSGTAVDLQVRISADRTRMGDWTDVTGNPGDVGFLLKPDSRFLQYRILLSTGDPAKTPVVDWVTVEIFPSFVL